MCVVHREQAAEVCVAFIISRAWYQTSMEGSCSFETSSHMCPARQQDGGMVVVVLLPPLKGEGRKLSNRCQALETQSAPGQGR